MSVRNSIRTPIERFWDKVEKKGPNECWVWKGNRSRGGYGVFPCKALRRTSNTYAHRASYTLFIGNPGDMHVLHRCDNPPCVNPAHLFLGTQKENTADMVRKGRHVKGERSPLTKLSDEDVRKIYQRYAEGQKTVAEIADEFNSATETISGIVRGRTWKHLYPGPIVRAKRKTFFDYFRCYDDLKNRPNSDRRDPQVAGVPHRKFKKVRRNR